MATPSTTSSLGDVNIIDNMKAKVQEPHRDGVRTIDYVKTVIEEALKGDGTTIDNEKAMVQAPTGDGITIDYVKAKIQESTFGDGSRTIDDLKAKIQETPVGVEVDTVVAEAVRQWNRKQHPALAGSSINDYIDEVRELVGTIAPPEAEWTFESPSLRQACRSMVGTAAGPAQIPAALLARAPRVALELLGRIGDLIRDAGRWPSALRSQEAQPTNATAAVLLVDFAIDKAYEDDTGLVVRQSDRVAGYASDSMVPERGLAQGDPGSPLGAAILAGPHARRFAADHDIMFTTYVDDRTMIADTPQDVESAADALAYLDWLSGQEDPGKLAVAAANVQGGNYQSYVDVLGVGLDLSGANPPETAPRALRRAQELLARLTKIKRVSRAARLPRRRVRQVVLANALASCAGMRRGASCPRRPSGPCGQPWRQPSRGGAGTPPGDTEGPLGTYLPKRGRSSPWAAAAGMLKRTLGGPPEAFVRQRWRSAQPAARPSAGWLLRTRELLDSMGWRTASDPFEVEIGDLTFSLTNTTRSGLDHMVREAWRSWMMKAGEAKGSRQDVVNIPGLDGKVLRDLLDSYDNGPDHSWAWRCVVGGEPSPDRLHHVDNAVAQDCAACRTRATTRHILRQCPATEAVTHSRGLRLPELAPELPEPERSALLLNGWIRAAWDVPTGVSSDIHAAATRRPRQLAKRILAYKFVVLRVFFQFYVLFSSLLDAVCVQSALLSDSGRSAPVERDRTSWRGVLHYALVSAILVAFCVQLALLKEISATFQSLESPGNGSHTIDNVKAKIQESAFGDGPTTIDAVKAKIQEFIDAQLERSNQAQETFDIAADILVIKSDPELAQKLHDVFGRDILERFSEEIAANPAVADSILFSHP
ncbi:unnamed protein product [Prorocentrum cordatum]|uniref:Reverse transcriptase domain-containing protein n=1 Tax=Prorocentrum cordatum TaxID=2364126 RepID=A0ABN9Y0Q4_9DINO|nr:unnamed protein product [Polarella glacialis]